MITLLNKLTEEELQEYLKCSKDPVYFINTYVKHYSLDNDLINFTLYPFQETLVNIFHNNKIILAKSSRQSGKSSTAIFYLLHRLLFTENVNIAIMPPSEFISQNLLGRLKNAYENLPDFLKSDVVIDNKTKFVLENNSQVTAYKISKSSICGNNFTDVFLDEFAFVDYETAKNFMNSLCPTTTNSRLIIVSSKNKGSYFNQLFDDAKNGNNGISTVEIGWQMVPGRDEKWKQKVVYNIGEEAFIAEYVV